MGFYIQGPLKGKADYLVKEFAAEKIPVPKKWPPPEGKAYICVVQNRGFDAAGFLYDEREFDMFSQPDSRPKVWLLMDREMAEEFSGYDKESEP